MHVKSALDRLPCDEYCGEYCGERQKHLAMNLDDSPARASHDSVNSCGLIIKDSSLVSAFHYNSDIAALSNENHDESEARYQCREKESEIQ